MKIAVLKLLGVAVCLHLCLAGCGQPKSLAAQKHYPLTGKIVAVNTKEHTATIDGAAIPHFMDAMTMEYPVPSASDLSGLHAGETISATVNVADDGTYSLSDIHAREAGK